METAYPFYLLKKMAGLHLGEVLASMAGISVSRTPYKLFHDYFWLQPLNRAFTCNVKHRLPTEGFRSPAYHWLSRRVFWLHIQWSWSQDLEFWFDFQYGVIRGLWPSTVYLSMSWLAANPNPCFWGLTPIYNIRSTRHWKGPSGDMVML